MYTSKHRPTAKLFFLFWQSDLVIAGKKIPFYIIGDAAYPLKPWLMKPYSSANGEAEIHFNHVSDLNAFISLEAMPSIVFQHSISILQKLSQARMCVERAFGRLKARWRSLLRCCDACPDNAKVFIAACIIMHNICEYCGDHYNEAVADEDHDNGLEVQDLNSGEDIRDALRDFMQNYN